MAPRILVVEDEEDLAFGLRRTLEFDGYTVDCAGDGAEGLAMALDEPYDLVILDVMLPVMRGMAVLEHLRREGIDTPVLILTALGDERSTVRGLRAGADDYVAKPFAIDELRARVAALLRRAARAPESGSRVVHEFGAVTVDPHARSVHRDGADVGLTPREFDLLLALIERSGVARSRHDLLREVWGHRARVETRTIDTHVAELRRKLEVDPSRPRHIVTVRKHGYRFEP